MITQLGYWQSLTGELACKWGVIEGISGPALIITNDRDEPSACIPFEALKFVLDMVKEP